MLLLVKKENAFFGLCSCNTAPSLSPLHPVCSQVRRENLCILLPHPVSILRKTNKVASFSLKWELLLHCLMDFSFLSLHELKRRIHLERIFIFCRPLRGC